MVRSSQLLRLMSVFALLVLGFVPIASAQPDPEPGNEQPEPSGPSAADKETARTLFREGDEKYRAGDYEEALKAFKAADEIMGVPTTGLEYARTLMMLNRLLEARDGFIRVANLEKRDGELPAQDDARREANQLAEDLAKRIPSIRVSVKNAPPSASIRLQIDDVEIPETAVEFPRKVDPGKHVVKVFVVGFEPTTREVDVQEKEEKVVEVELEAAKGEQNLVNPWEEGGNGDTGEQGPLSVLSWIGFSVGVVGLGVGIGAGAFAVSEKGALQDVCKGKGPNGETQCPADQGDRLDTAKTVAHISTAGFIVGGVGVAVGVAGILFRKALPDALAGTDAPITFSPYVGVGAAGVTGSF